MQKVNEERVKQAQANLQARYNADVEKVEKTVAAITGISDMAHEHIRSVLNSEYAAKNKEMLDLVNSFFDEVPEEVKQ